MTKYNWEEIQLFVNDGNGYRQIYETYGCNSNTISRAVKKGLLVMPNRDYSRSKRIQLGLTKPRHSEETKARISEAMKQRHAEGKAWNIGQSRWNNEPSWPEQFFMMVIENEFSDKDYVREMPFGKYSLDFAWPHLKKCIEIDGEQHQRFEEYRQRDVAKDKMLNEQGWQVLRIKWKELYADSKTFISKAKDFLECHV